MSEKLSASALALVGLLGGCGHQEKAIPNVPKDHHGTADMTSRYAYLDPSQNTYPPETDLKAAAIKAARDKLAREGLVTSGTAKPYCIESTRGDATEIGPIFPLGPLLVNDIAKTHRVVGDVSAGVQIAIRMACDSTDCVTCAVAAEVPGTEFCGEDGCDNPND